MNKFKISLIFNIILLLLLGVGIYTFLIPRPNESNQLNNPVTYNNENTYTLFNPLLDSEGNEVIGNTFLVEYDAEYRPIAAIDLGDTYNDIFMSDSGLYIVNNETQKSVCYKNTNEQNLVEQPCTAEDIDITGTSSLVGGANVRVDKTLESTQSIYDVTPNYEYISQYFPYSLDNTGVTFNNVSYGPIAFDAYYLHS